MKIFLSLIAGLLMAISSFGQRTGLIDYPNLGLKFTVPSGWVGQETELGFVMGSHTVPGLVLVMTNEVKSIADMHKEALVGIVDENGTDLKPIQEMTPIGSNAIGGEFNGVLEWQPARAYVIGMVNPKGYGVTIVVVTSQSSYAPIHEEVCRSIANSTVFSKIEFVDQSGQWKETLSNARLTYMNSSYSTGVDYVGDESYTTSTGYSDRVVIDLCAQGYFNYSSSNTTSFDIAAGSAYGNSNDAGAGKWEVVNNPIGQPFLKLNFYDGKVGEYLLEKVDGKTLLDGSRYFKTYGTYADDGPDCQ